ncbi:putative ribosome-binding factor A, mitochondrial isoform X2 [Osmerus eperlanus]|uniref:putative ribosome-binding factor A, mitochondrial isoform X2 n=1 Tax=Osmerus eperlanus TaxID=29151 RepID=UPI002E153D29
MFTIITYSRLRPCVLRQYYVSSGGATKMSVDKEVDCRRYHPCLEKNTSKQLYAAAGTERKDVHTSAVNEAKSLMKKFANKSKKKGWYETPPRSAPSQTDFVKIPKKQSQEDTQRTRILNSVLYKAISELLTSPELNSKVINYGVEISKVSMSPDFSSCRVYWKISGVSEQDDVIQMALERSSPRIRYLIMSHQTMGGVPPLVFIKDKQYAAMAKVEMLLKEADFGPKDLDGYKRLHMAETHSPAVAVKPVLFGVDHEALGRQIQDYKLRIKEAGLESEVSSPAFTEAQLAALEEYRKQKIIAKKKKSKRPMDDDITPREFLLAQMGQGQRAEPEEDRAFSQEEVQLKELMADEDKKS